MSRWNIFFNDFPPAVLFAVNVFFIFFLAMTSGAKALSNAFPVIYSKTGKIQEVSGAFDVTGGLLFTMIVVGLVSLLWLKIIVFFSGNHVVHICKGIFGGLLASSLTCLIIGCWLYSLVFFVSACLCLCYYFYMKKHIAFATINMKIACAAIQIMPSIVAIATLMLALQIVWCTIWSVALLGSATNLDDRLITVRGVDYELDRCYTYSARGPNLDFSPYCSSAKMCFKCVCGDDTVYKSKPCIKAKVDVGHYIFLLLNLIWGTTVIRNVVHVTISGAVASWWFMVAHPDTAVYDSFRRTIRGCMGSICFGSLLLAIAQTARVLLYMLRGVKKSSLARTCAEVLIGMIERVMETTNRYAFCYVAIYGFDFRTAGYSVADLFRSKGWSGIVNDCLIYDVLKLICVAVGGIGFCTGYLYGKTRNMDAVCVQLLASFGAIVGFSLSSVFAKVISSAVATVFVCFAEDPHAFCDNHHDLYNEMMQVWNEFQLPTMQKNGYDKRPTVDIDNDFSVL